MDTTQILFDALKPPRNHQVHRGSGSKMQDISTMKRGARGHPIGIRDKLRNLRIRKRSKGERPYAVIKNVFQQGW